MEKEKPYLELVEAQSNLKLAEIKNNKIAGRSNSLSDNNSNDNEVNLENDIVSKKYNPVQSYDRSFCKDRLAKNSYQYYQIPVDNEKSNESFRDEAKSENNENKTSNSTTVIEPINKFIDELLEVQEVSSSELDPIPALSIADALTKELESHHLTPVDLLTFNGNATKWPEFIENFKTRIYNKVSFTNSMKMQRLLRVLKGKAKRAVEWIGTNRIFLPTTLKY